MFTIDSIKKVMANARETEKKYSNVKADDIKICISAGNRKIGHVLNVSLMPVMTCPNCTECKFLCYDLKACLQYADTVIDARMRNTVLLKKDRERFFRLIIEKCARRRKNKFFRWHVAGDIIDIDYFSRMVQIAKMFPDFIFWTYTKNYSVVNQYVKENGNSKEKAIPSNLSVMFSEWDGMTMVNPYNFGIFSCKLKNGNKNRSVESFETMHKCPGNCDICKKANRGCLINENTYCDEH